VVDTEGRHPRRCRTSPTTRNHFPRAEFQTSDWTGQGNFLPPPWSVPADVEQEPRSVGAFVFFFTKESIMRGIGLWLLGVPVVVIIGLYLLNVI
jgi:hypothetical protein